MADSPQCDSDGVLRLSIKSDGQTIADTIRIVSVHIRRGVGNIPTARLVVNDGHIAEGAWPVADSATFKPGATITIAAGYGDREQTVFEGIVIKLGMRISGDNDSRLEVDCRHKAVKMTVGRKNANYVDRTDSAIIKSIVQSHGLTATVDATSEKHGGLTQYHCTDWDFVLARAEVNGLLVIADDDKLRIQAPVTSAAAVLSVEWGRDLIEFQADVDSLSQLQSVQATAWDPKTQAVSRGTAAAPQMLNAQGDLDSRTLAGVLGLASFRLQTPVPLPVAELSKWGKAQQLKAGLARIRGRMKFQGSAAAKPGSLIELKGVGARYSGNVFVGAVEHEIADGNWLTTVEFGLAPEWFCERADVLAPAAAGLLPGAEGLQIGIVTQLEGDPAGEQRIQIKLPVLEASTPTVWARLLQFHASGGFGAFFLPEVGDEVVVGFFNHDPSHPVVLGSLYSSKHAPAYALAAPNDTKALVTRCKHKLEFDEKDKVITVTTPANNKIVLSDKDKSILLQDQNGNMVELHPGGITLDTPKDLKMTAKGSITIDAVGALSISSKADLKCAGLNVACEAQVGFTGKGSATAELSAAGQTTVKGAVVMIN
jgi:Rhs element Vgr protein